MARSIGTIAGRAVLASPLLLVALTCLRGLDIAKINAHSQTFLESGVIEWDNGKSIRILDRFWGVEFLDEMWRGATVTFAPSSLGFDEVSWWHMFSFLTDLGPVYIIWILESCRPGNTFTPAYIPTIFSFAGQLLGLGCAGSVFYFLCLTFGPLTSDLIRSSKAAGRLSRVNSRESAPLLLPVTLLLHTAQIFAAYAAPEPTTRHIWIWAWQMSPLYIGILSTLLANIISLLPASVARPLRFTASAQLALGVPALISAGTWIYTLVCSPYSLSTIFIPVAAPQDDFMPHARRAFQIDQLTTFAGAFLWMSFHVLDMYSAGLVAAGDVFYSLGLLPVVTAVAGPGAALSFLWFWREGKITGSA